MPFPFSNMSRLPALKAVLAESLTRAWYRPGLHPLLIPLLPLASLVGREAQKRYRRFQTSPPEKLPVPVIVVGNMTAGGTGKTPLVAALVKRLQANGWRPGIISRGFGSGKGGSGNNCGSQLVTPESDPAVGGDEPVMLAGLTGVPVVVNPERRLAVELLLRQTGCNLVISDDGLQHYRLHRDLEIAVVDGARMFGNGRCLPAGPLREPLDRLADVDLIVSNGSLSGPLPEGAVASEMRLAPVALRPVSGRSVLTPPDTGEPVHGVAGIGHPERFFLSLEQQGFSVSRHPFPDHYAFGAEDLSSLGEGAVIMTAKDAVKCRAFARDNWWYLPVEAQLPETFWDAVLHRLNTLH